MKIKLEINTRKEMELLVLISEGFYSENRVTYSPVEKANFSIWSDTRTLILKKHALSLDHKFTKPLKLSLKYHELHMLDSMLKKLSLPQFMQTLQDLIVKTDKLLQS